LKGSRHEYAIRISLTQLAHKEIWQHYYGMVNWTVHQLAFSGRKIWMKFLAKVETLTERKKKAEARS